MSGNRHSLALRLHARWWRWRRRTLKRPVRASAIVAVEDEPEPYGRILEWGSVSWREPPLALLEQGPTVQAVGRIDKLERLSPAPGVSWVRADMRIVSAHIARAARKGHLGCALDGGSMEARLGEDPTGTGRFPLMVIESITILSVSIVPIDQAPWPEARIQVLPHVRGSGRD